MCPLIVNYSYITHIQETVKKSRRHVSIGDATAHYSDTAIRNTTAELSLSLLTNIAL